MKHLLVLLVPIFLTFHPRLIARTDSLTTQKYYSQIGKFKIHFPGKPEESQFGQHTLIGDVYSYSYIYQDSDKATYFVICSFYPYGIKPDTLKFLESSKEGYLKSLTLIHEEEKQVKMNGFTGLLYKANTNDLFVIKTDFWINQMLYQIYIERTDRYPTEKEITEFINSFELVE